MAEKAQRIRKRQRPQSEAHESTITVTSSSFGTESRERRQLDIHKFESDPAYVRVNMGATKNLGNYESFRVDVSISVPCYPEEVEEVLPRVADRVAAHLDTELEDDNG